MFFLKTLIMVFSKLANGNKNVTDFSASCLDNIEIGMLSVKFGVTQTRRIRQVVMVMKAF